MAQKVEPLAFLEGLVADAAPRLLGCTIERTFNGHTLRGRIVEVEAYDQADAASHSYKGRTPRTNVMFGPPGHLYVYFTYGMHYCCNVVVGPTEYGAAILIRAIEPLEGEAYMAKRRGGRRGLQTANGPAKLCQALAIDKSLNGHDLHKKPLVLIPGKALKSNQIVQSTRIGITQEKDKPWRFYIKDNPYVSKPQ
ncbi:MAG TPA: DNA-3-methyladenine glycosylase [Candidatus Saccharimonadales bacterium]|nr:DNA-3-methyladenine glycosylase [Candidatus Saccharimonadales bacterium]